MLEWAFAGLEGLASISVALPDASGEWSTLAASNIEPSCPHLQAGDIMIVTAQARAQLVSEVVG